MARPIDRFLAYVWEYGVDLDEELLTALVPIFQVVQHDAKIEALEAVLASPYRKGDTLRQMVQEMTDHERRHSLEKSF